MIIYLAGAETWNAKFSEAGIQNRLFSFYYMRKMKKSAQMINQLYTEREKWANEGKELRLFLDSGGFTYNNYDGEKPNPFTYEVEFRRFVESTADLWTVVAELDIENDEEGAMAVSLEQVDEWREALVEVCPNKVLPVWHENRGPDAWQSYCDDPRYPYLALGSGIELGAKNRMCAAAHRAGKQVHGFAETKIQTEAKYLKCDSVDSSTWLRATKYGGLFVFKGNVLRVLDHKHKEQRRLFKGYFKVNGIDEAKILAEDQDELTKCSLIAWRNMAARLDRSGGEDGERDAETSGHERVTTVANDESTDDGRARGSQSEVGRSEGESRTETSRRAGPFSRRAAEARARERGTEVAGKRDDREQSESAETASGRLSAETGHGEAGVIDRAAENGAVGTLQRDRDAVKKPRLERLPGGGFRVVEPDREACKTSGKQSTDGVDPYHPLGPSSTLADAYPELSSFSIDLLRQKLRASGFLTEEEIATIIDRRQKSGRGSAAQTEASRMDLVASNPPIAEAAKGAETLVIRPAISPQPTCSVCSEPQYNSRSGMVCKNGHGGAPSLTVNMGVVPFPRPEHSKAKIGDEGDQLEQLLEEQHERAVQARDASGKSGKVGGAVPTLEQKHSDTGAQSGPNRLNEMAGRGSEHQGATSTSLDEANAGYLRQTVPNRLAGSPTGIPSLSAVKPPEGKVTASIEGTRHLPVLQTTGHEPDVEENLRELSKLPPLRCDNCAMQGECPEYEAKAVCYYTKQFKALPIRDLRSHKAIMEHLVGMDYQRTLMALMIEQNTAGGQLDPRVSSQLDGFIQRLDQYRQLAQARPNTLRVSVEASGTGAAGKGILSQLFGVAIEGEEKAEMQNEPSRTLAENSEIDVTPKAGE